MPQRGNMRVKTSVRAECRPELTFSTNGELAESASSSGRKLRSALCTAIARSAPAMPTWTWRPKRVVAPDDVPQQLVVAAVVRRVDDALVLPPRPRMRSGAAERDPALPCERVQLRRAARASRRPPGRSPRSGRCEPRSPRRSARRPRSARSSVTCCAAAYSSSKRSTRSSESGSSSANSSSTATVRSVPPSNARARVREHVLPGAALFLSHRPGSVPM